MATSSINDRLAQERRARLQAEQLLALRSSELYSANQKLSQHATALSTQVIEQREENEFLKGKTHKTQAQLEAATERAITAQRRLWDALTATEDGFAIFDRDWRLVAANPAFFDVFDGVSDVSEGASYEAILRIAVEEGLVDLQSEDADDWLDRMIGRWEMSPIPRVDIKLWNGAYIRLNDKQTPQGDYVSLAVDITNNIRRERQVRAARDRALSASRAKSTFLANMSHEIRTPMNGVVSMAELLRETSLTEEQALYADTIRNSGEALLVIINDVLDFSKIEAGKLELHKDSFDLNASIREIFRLLQPGFEGRQLELKLDYDIFLPDRMIGDRGRIRQVLTNLIGNAVKFTPEGSVTVRVLAVPPPTGDEDMMINIVVEDTGIGIAPEKQAHVFGEFNQVEGEANRRHDGTGLGLAISYRLVELMGGEMWLESEEGRGSAFGFRLPMGQDPQARTVPVAGLPVTQSRVLMIGGGSGYEDQIHDALGRLHAEASLLRRIPTARDLEGTQAVIVCDGVIDPAEIAHALDAVGFSGSRLCTLAAPDIPRGFHAAALGAGLEALRAQLLTRPQTAATCEVTETPSRAAVPEPAPTAPEVEAEALLLAPEVYAPATPAPEADAPARELETTSKAEGASPEHGVPVSEPPALAPNIPAPEPDTTIHSPAKPPATPDRETEIPTDLHEPGPSPHLAPIPDPALSSAGDDPTLRSAEPAPASDYRAPDAELPAATGPAAAPDATNSKASDPIEAAPNEAALVHPMATPAPPARTRPRLLAAEDNKTNQLVFRTMLKGLDVDLEMTNNGVELVAAYMRERPDLLMTDISMPEMDGLEAARSIRAHEAEHGLTPVIMIAMTAHALEGDKERILAAGLDDYITKPLKKAIIQGRVSDHLGDANVPDAARAG